MKPELQEQVFNWVAQTSEKITTWTAKEMPPFIAEYLEWKYFENMMNLIRDLSYIGFSALIFIVCVFLCRHLFKKINAVPTSEEYKYAPFVAAFGVVGLMCLVICVGNLIEGDYFDYGMECYKIKHAPKVYLVEQAKEILTQK